MKYEKTAALSFDNKFDGYRSLSDDSIYFDEKDLEITKPLYYIRFDLINTSKTFFKVCLNELSFYDDTNSKIYCFEGAPALQNNNNYYVNSNEKCSFYFVFNSDNIKNLEGKLVHLNLDLFNNFDEHYKKSFEFYILYIIQDNIFYGNKEDKQSIRVK